MERTVLITGATGGIGTALARRLAGSGYGLVLAARTQEPLEALASSISGQRAQNISTERVDMTDLTSVMGFAGRLAAQDTTLDGVVLMPPQVPPTPHALPGEEVWEGLFHDHFIGPLALLKAAIARMRPDPALGRRCKVVIVSGISSVQVLSHYATNNVIRAAWLAQAKTLAFALGPQGIHVNTISLGGTLSDHYVDLIRGRAQRAGQTFDQQISEETANVPLRKYGTPEEAAGAIAALLSEFSDHLTGVNIIHDGGFTRAY
jgi:3-oxoacyl-[acyl-carrier protein] reductase